MEQSEGARQLRSYANVVSSGNPGPTKKSQKPVDPVSYSHPPKDPVQPPVVIRASDSHNETTSGESSPRNPVKDQVSDPVKPVEVKSPTLESKSPDVPKMARESQSERRRVRTSADVVSSRVPRATQDELSTVAENLAAAARLITAISLQNGLVDGSISPDAITAELLNIEATELSKLKIFDKKKVEDFMQKLKTTGSSFSDDAKALMIENAIVLLNDWRLRYTDLGDLEDTSIADTFSSVVEQTKKNQAAVVKLETATVDAKSALAKIPNLDPNDKGAVFSALDTLQRSLGTLADGPKALATLTEELKKLKLLVDGNSISASPQGKLVALLDDFFLRKADIDNVRPEDYDALVKLISIVFALVPDAKASEGDLKVIEAIAVSRRHFHDRQLTTGFLKGYSDIGKIPSDTQDPQLKTIVHGFNVEMLKAGLLPLQSLMIQTDEVNKKWTGMSADSIQVVEEVREVSAKLITPGTQPDEATLLKIRQCADGPKSPTSFYDDINALIKNSTALPNQIDSLIVLSEQMAESFQKKASDFSKLKDAIKFPSDDAKKIAESPTVLAEFKKHSTAEVMGALQGVEPKLGELKNSFEESNQVIQRSADMKKVVTALLGHPDMKKMVEFFDRLKKLPSEFSSAYSSITLLRDIRKFGKTPRILDNANNLAVAIGESRRSVETLEKTAAAVKGNEDGAVKQVARLEVKAKDVLVFAQGSLVVNKIDKILRIESQLKNFMVGGETVAAAIRKIQDPRHRNELVADWGDFQKTKAELGKLTADLEQKRNKMVIAKAAKFADFGPTFSGLGGLIDVSLDIRKARKVLEALLPTNPEFMPMKTLLDSMDPSDLQFARFNSALPEIAAILPSIDGAFANFVVLSSNGDEESILGSILLYSGLGIGTICGIGSVVGIGYVVHKRCTKSKVPVDHVKIPANVANSTTSTDATTTSDDATITDATKASNDATKTDAGAAKNKDVLFHKKIILKPIDPTLSQNKPAPNRPAKMFENPKKEKSKKIDDAGAAGAAGGKKDKISKSTDKVKSNGETGKAKKKTQKTTQKSKDKNSQPKDKNSQSKDKKSQSKNKANGAKDQEAAASASGNVLIDPPQIKIYKDKGNRLWYELEGKDYNLFDRLTNIFRALMFSVSVDKNGLMPKPQLQFLNRIPRKGTKTPLARLNDKRAATNKSFPQTQLVEAPRNRTRGSSADYNANASPELTGGFLKAIDIRLPLHSRFILTETPMAKDECKDQKRSDAGTDKGDEVPNDEKFIERTCEDALSMIQRCLIENIPLPGWKTIEKYLDRDYNARTAYGRVKNAMNDIVSVMGKQLTALPKLLETIMSLSKQKNDEIENTKSRVVEGEESCEAERSTTGSDTEDTGKESYETESSTTGSDTEDTGKESYETESSTTGSDTEDTDEESCKTARKATGSDAENAVAQSTAGNQKSNVETTMDDTERAGGAETPKDPNNTGNEDTRGSFYHMIYSHGTEHIVQTADRTSSYHPTNEGEEMEHGEFLITCKKRDLAYYEHVNRYQLQIKHKTTGKTHTVVHWTILGWMEGGTPWHLVSAIISVLLEVRLKPTPTCVLSDYITGRAAVFVFIEYFFQMLLDTRHTIAEATSALTLLRSHNYKLIESGRQLFFACLVTFCYLQFEADVWKDKKNKDRVALFNEEILQQNVEALENYDNIEWEGHRKHETQLEKLGEPPTVPKTTAELLNDDHANKRQNKIKKANGGDENENRNENENGSTTDCEPPAVPAAPTAPAV